MHNTSYVNCFYRNKQERTTEEKWLGVYCVYFKGKWMCIKKEGSLFMVDPRDHSSYMFWHKIYTICKKVKYIFFPLIYLVKITGRPRWFVSNEHTGWLLCAMKCIRYWIKVDKCKPRKLTLIMFLFKANMPRHQCTRDSYWNKLSTPFLVSLVQNMNEFFCCQTSIKYISHWNISNSVSYMKFHIKKIIIFFLYMN